ncbi:hypothetical protein AWH69_03660 [Janibacter melonis]|uniref:Uncharacterized protein n=1 Tax=Janibacter melonis TaxID=262209 RepID=A0A176QGD5_9MICO|nr:hypothetical protein [Janibacter melonis]OAB88877.1 hypothetical protein AWH69_03660 [Janibacter melonis]
MSRRRDQPTFAEMVRQPTWSEKEASTTERHAVRRLLVEGARLVHEGGWADVWTNAAGEVVYAHGEIARLRVQG